MHRKSGITAERSEMADELEQYDPQNHIVKAWFLACHVDTDAATMIAEQHEKNVISAEQTLAAFHCVASSDERMISYS